MYSIKKTSEALRHVFSEAPLVVLLAVVNVIVVVEGWFESLVALQEEPRPHLVVEPRRAVAVQDYAVLDIAKYVWALCIILINLLKCKKKSFLNYKNV